MNNRVIKIESLNIQPINGKFAVKKRTFSQTLNIVFESFLVSSLSTDELKQKQMVCAFSLLSLIDMESDSQP